MKVIEAGTISIQQDPKPSSEERANEIALLFDKDRHASVWLLDKSNKLSNIRQANSNQAYLVVEEYQKSYDSKLAESIYNEIRNTGVDTLQVMVVEDNPSSWSVLSVVLFIVVIIILIFIIQGIMIITSKEL